jgi:hypothetical protein
MADVPSEVPRSPWHLALGRSLSKLERVPEHFFKEQTHSSGMPLWVRIRNLDSDVVWHFSSKKQINDGPKQQRTVVEMPVAFADVVIQFVAPLLRH